MFLYIAVWAFFPLVISRRHYSRVSAKDNVFVLFFLQPPDQTCMARATRTKRVHSMIFALNCDTDADYLI